MDTRTLRNDLLLLLTASIWGLAFVAQRAGMEHVGPFLYGGVRFALGALALVPLLVVRARRERRAEGAASKARTRPGALTAMGALAGLFLFLAASTQQIGIVTTSAGKAGFITGLYVVIVPLSGLFWGQKVGGARWVGAVLAGAGLYLLSVQDASGFVIARGDLFVLASAFLWAAQIQVVGWISPRVDPIRLAIIEFATCAALSMIAALLLEEISLQGILAAAVPILYGGVGSVGIGFTLQVVAQRGAHPAHAAIIMSLESVFAALGGWLMLGESFSPRGLLGCALMLLGMVSSQAYLLGFRRRRRAAAAAGRTPPRDC